MFAKGFPFALQSLVSKVSGFISTKTYHNVSQGIAENSKKEEYSLLNGSTISFPYRIYFIDNQEIDNSLKSREEKLIYDCIFTRSCDGYVRERHLQSILSEDYPEWCMPYILKLSSEYVEEIVSMIYDDMKHKDNAQFQAFCANNPDMFRYAYARMTSYWNEFYRGKYYRFHDYTGYKLYKECFGYSARFDKFCFHNARKRQ